MPKLKFGLPDIEAPQSHRSMYTTPLVLQLAKCLGLKVLPSGKVGFFYSIHDFAVSTGPTHKSALILAMLGKVVSLEFTPDQSGGHRRGPPEGEERTLGEESTQVRVHC